MDTTGWWVRVSSAPVAVRVLTRPHAVAHFARCYGAPQLLPRA
jgi:hypothetical protein